MKPKLEILGDDKNAKGRAIDGLKAEVTEKAYKFPTLTMESKLR
jgi:hypothetical protein